MGCFGGSNGSTAGGSWIWILVLLFLCGGCGSNIGGSICGSGTGTEGDSSTWMIILLLLFCCCGSGLGSNNSCNMCEA